MALENEAEQTRDTTELPVVNNKEQVQVEDSDKMEVDHISRYQLIQCYNFHMTQCSSPSQKRCSEHPNCIGRAKSNTIRFGIWQNPAVLIPACIGQDPMTDIRDTSIPVGLVNLGATCYLNSFIQCLFMNTTFRASFLQFDSSDIQDGSAKEFISHLQQLFVRMQRGPRKSINPQDLVSMLKLDVDHQQDILEFVKLLLEYLGHFLKCSPKPEIKNLVESEFRGSILHVTSCEDCGSSSISRSFFYEISLPIVPPDLSASERFTEPFEVSGTGYKFAFDNVSDSFSMIHAVSTGSVELQWCLNNYFSLEVLCDSNQYFCSLCNQKCDATRSVFVETLPPVLNIQIMRFVYDQSTQSKVKLNTSVEIPKTLEFQLMTSSGLGFDTLVTYDLCAIVSHFGESTHSGHYVAEIKDEVSGAWYKFNDHLVELMKGPPPTVSKTAYLVVYSRRDRRVVSEPILPSHLESSMEQEVSDFWTNADTYVKKREKLESFIKVRREEVKEIYKIPPTVVAVDEYDTAMIIPELWLRSWILGTPVKPLPQEDYEYEAWHPGPIENKVLLCGHGLLDPFKRSQMLRIPQVAWSYLSKRNGFDVSIKASDLCEKCSAKKISADQKRSRDEQEKNERILARKGEMGILKELGRNRNFPLPTSPPGNGKWYLIPEDWRRRWLAYCRAESDEPPGIVDTNGLFCKHGFLGISPYPPIIHFKDQLLPTSPIGIMCEVPPLEWEYIVNNYEVIGPEATLIVSEMPISGPARVVNKNKVRYNRPWSALSIECSPTLCLECSAAFPVSDSHRNQSFVKVFIDELLEAPVEGLGQGFIGGTTKRPSRSKQSSTLRNFSVDISLDATVKGLREVVSSLVGLLPDDPSLQLYFNSKFVDDSDDEKKCSGLGIMAGSSINFVVISATGANQDSGKEGDTSRSKGQREEEDPDMMDEKGFEGTQLHKVSETLHAQGHSEMHSYRSSDPLLIWFIVDPRRGMLGLSEGKSSQIHHYESVFAAKRISEKKLGRQMILSGTNFDYMSRELTPILSRLHCLLVHLSDYTHSALLAELMPKAPGSSSKSDQSTASSAKSKFSKKRKR